AEKGGWGSSMPKDTGLGIAMTFGRERTMPTWLACAARVRVDRGHGKVILENLTLVVDAGTIVHPDGALAQVEGAALWGANLALHEGSEFVKGRGLLKTSLSTTDADARCSNSARGNAAGRSATRAPRTSASAGTNQSKDCPIARGTRALHIGQS